ncbi:MAG TPA: hypothetical protein VG944_09620 [Fimbriimonas sp.]|nr:hypothetical protein [Fimbriimonas sp.]
MPIVLLALAPLLFTGLGQEPGSKQLAAGDFVKQFGPEGSTSSSFRKEFETAEDSVIKTSPFDNKDGHHYIALFSLGKCGLSPSEAIDFIFQDPLSLVPALDTADFKENRKWELGSDCTFHLQSTLDAIKRIVFKELDPDASKEMDKLYDLVKTEPYKVTDRTKFSFTLSTKPGAAIADVTTSGLVRDSSNELWLVEESRGTPDDNTVLQMIADYSGEALWITLAGNLKKTLDNHELSVNGPTTTGIQLKKGDKVSIHAFGNITFGASGDSGPDGFATGAGRKVVLDGANHGALVGRVGSKWHPIGSQGTLEADADGPLVLNVNDSAKDRTGNFTVYVTSVKRPEK